MNMYKLAAAIKCEQLFNIKFPEEFNNINRLPKKRHYWFYGISDGGKTSYGTNVIAKGDYFNYPITNCWRNFNN